MYNLSQTDGKGNAKTRILTKNLIIFISSIKYEPLIIFVILASETNKVDTTKFVKVIK